MAKQSPTQTKAVIDYYDNTRPEYRLIWRNRHNLGIHFGYYDADHTTHDEAVLNLNAKLADRASIKRSDIVLDAGCGVGGSAIWLADNIGCECVGINIVPRQIERAKQNAVNRGVQDKVHFQVADFADTGLEGSSFSIVWGLESFVHAQNKQDVINEAFRLLRPGGRLIIAEYLLKDEPLSANERDLLLTWEKGWAMPSLHARKDFEKMLKQAGFVTTEIDDWTEAMKPSFVRLTKIGKRFRPAVSTLKLAKIVNIHEMNNLAATEAQMELLDKKCWRYKVVLAVKPG